MNTSNIPGKLSILFGALLLLSIVGLAHAQKSNELDQALARFRKVKTIQTDFKEAKQIALLAAPLKSSGKIYFDASKRAFARVTEKPEASKMVVIGDKLITTRRGKTKEMKLDENPIAATLIKGIRNLFLGEKKALEKDFTLTFQTQKEAWTITLTPKDKRLKQLIKDIRVGGKELVLSSLVVNEQNGDVATTSFSNTKLGKATPKGVFP